MGQIIVSKFGGSSMMDTVSIRRSAGVAQSRNSNIVLVSATYGTTNDLISLTSMASTGNWNECEKLLNKIKNKHTQLATELECSEETTTSIFEIFEELSTIIKGVSLLKDCSKKAFDSIQAVGERMSSHLMMTALRQQYGESKQVEYFDVRKVLRTDDTFGKAAPDIAQIKLLSDKHLMDAKHGQRVYVTQGFIGATEDNQTTTLGRGGSDYSAALIAEGLGADILEIWTDVAGIATTDPRICKNAKPIDQITFREAAELAVFGGKILHPSTLIPAMRSDIAVYVGSSYESDKPGTWIKKANETNSAPLVRAMALRKEQSIVTLSTPKMLYAHGFLANVFTLFDRYKISIDAITTSEISVAFTIDATTMLDKNLMRELEAFAEVKIEEGLTVVSLIGNNINYTSGLAKDIFTALNGENSINVRMICQGASKHNFCFLVKSESAPEALQRLHSFFIEEA